jgi:UDP-N-acetylenolpyruvoylglucosamine reductase
MNFRIEGVPSGLGQLLEPFVKEGIPFHLYKDLSSKQRFVKETGKAMAFIEIQTPEADTDMTWGRIADLSKMTGMPVMVFGGRTNTLISEKDYKGILVVQQYRQGRGKIRLNRGKVRTITASGAVSLARVVKFACDRGYDLSYLAGIPGTLGGATVGNSGRSLTGESIGDHIQRITTFDLLGGTEVVFNLKSQGGFFKQRGSRLQRINYPTTELVVRSVILAPPFIGEKAGEKLAERKEERKLKNAGAACSAGSFFINKDDRLRGIEGGLTRDYIRRLMEEGMKLNRRNIAWTKFYQFLRIGSSWGEKPTDVEVAAFLQKTINALNSRFGFKPRSEVTILGSDGALSVEEYIKASIG